MYIFSMENPFFRFIGRLVDLIYINILTLICCIPVFTAGAAFSAMYHVLIRLSLKEEVVITVPFFREFKSCFKKATLVWLPSLLIILILISNGYLVYQGILEPYPTLKFAVQTSIVVILIGIVMFLNYYFAIISRYDTDIKQSIKNSGLMIMGYFPRSICMIIILLSPLALMTLSDYFLIFWFFYGISFPGYVNATLLGGLFIKTEQVNKE